MHVSEAGIEGIVGGEVITGSADVEDDDESDEEDGVDGDGDISVPYTQYREWVKTCTSNATHQFHIPKEGTVPHRVE